MYSYKYPKILLTACCLLLVLSAVTGSTLAYFTDSAAPLVNTFIPSRVTTDVEELLDGTVKSQVALQNTGSTEAYLRAAISVTWKAEDGTVYSKAPVPGEDYALSLDLDGGWVRASDGFYYWVLPVHPAETHPQDCATGVLITSCSPLGSAPAGYALNVQIIGSGIQSVPTSVVTEHWGSGVTGVGQDGRLQIRGGL